MTKIPKIWDSRRMSIFLDIFDPHPKPSTTDYFCKYGMTRSELRGRALAEITSSSKEKDELIDFLNNHLSDENILGLLFYILEQHYDNDHYREVIDYSIDKDYVKIYERTIQTLNIILELGLIYF